MSGRVWGGRGGILSLFRFMSNLEIDLFLRHKRISHGPEKVTDRHRRFPNAY